MASPLFTISEYFKHRLRAQGAHDVHSPFLFELYNEVVRKQDDEHDFGLRSLRRQLYTSQNIRYQDPKSNQWIVTNTRKLAKRVASSHKFSCFLTRLVSHLGYQSVLETGTSLGFNSIYLSTIPSLRIGTIEGSKTIAQVAQANFDRFYLSQIKLIEGSVREVFESSLTQYKPSLVFLDADHRSETIQFYLDTISANSAPVECIIIHDIYWSADMKAAWKKIISNQDYNLTIDLFEAGLIFPNYPMEKQHFTFRL